MKVILDNLITALSASTEDPEYPIENVLITSPKESWRATNTSAVVYLTVSAGDCISLFNCNARTVTVTVSVGATQVFTNTYSLDGINSWFDWFTQRSVFEKQLWVDYGYQSEEHTISLVFSGVSSGSVIECGVIWAGVGFKYTNPQYGVKEGLIDYSVVKKLENGGIYRRKRDTVREFSMTLDLYRDGSLYNLLRRIQVDIGTAPRPWLVADFDNTHWAVFAGTSGLPEVSHGEPTMSTVTATLLEEV